MLNSAVRINPLLERVVSERKCTEKSLSPDHDLVWHHSTVRGFQSSWLTSWCSYKASLK